MVKLLIIVKPKEHLDSEPQILLVAVDVQWKKI